MPIRVSSKRAAVPAAAAPARTGLPFGFPPVPPGTPQKPPGVSLCMIVKNEERFLADCLRSVEGAVDEICIVDTGSTDRTIEIARSFGATVIERPWRNDFAWARNESLALATKRWILMLDADEVLREVSKPTLRALAQVPAHRTGVWLRCFNQSDDYRGTGAMSHALVRVFPNSEHIRFRGMIHEFVCFDGATEGIAAVVAPLEIDHFGYLTDVVNDRDKAQRNFEIVKAAVEAEPLDPFAWFNLASTAFMIGDYEVARSGFEKMRELNGSTPRGFIANGYAILAEVYCDKMRDPRRGEEIARAALEFSPHYANAHFQLGKALAAQRRYDEARAAFELAIDDGKFGGQQFVVDDQVSIWKAHSEIGSSYVAEQDDESAIRWFRKGLENAPKVQPLRLNLARALERSGAIDEARDHFRSVFEDYGDDQSAVDWVNFLLRRGDGAAALDVIERTHASLSDTHAAALLHAAAQIAAKLGTTPPERYLELAAARLPGSADVLNWLESIYRERGDRARLDALLAAEAQTEPVGPADFLRRSYQANVAGEHARGLQLAERGLLLAPGHEHLHYNAAVAAASLGEPALALEHLDAVTSTDGPIAAPARMLRAGVCRSLGRDDEAIAALEGVLASDPAHPDALAQRASLLESRGDLGAAEGTLRRLLDANASRGAVELAAFLMRRGRFDEAARVAEVGLGR